MTTREGKDGALEAKATIERRRLAFAVWLTVLAVPIIVLDNFPQPGAGASQNVTTDQSVGMVAASAHPVTGTAAAPAIALLAPTTAAPTTLAPTTAPPTTVAPTTAPPTTAVPETTAPPQTAPPTPPPPEAPPPGNVEEGGASWYRYAEGTCAHRTLPRGTVVTVTNLATGASTVCTVADRGPYIEGRIIDLDATVFDDLAPLSTGVIDVRITW